MYMYCVQYHDYRFMGSLCSHWLITYAARARGVSFSVTGFIRGHRKLSVRDSMSSRKPALIMTEIKRIGEQHYIASSLYNMFGHWPPHPILVTAL